MQAVQGTSCILYSGLYGALLVLQEMVSTEIGCWSRTLYNIMVSTEPDMVATQATRPIEANSALGNSARLGSDGPGFQIQTGRGKGTASTNLRIRSGHAAEVAYYTAFLAYYMANSKVFEGERLLSMPMILPWVLVLDSCKHPKSTRKAFCG
jgi:hypothetical protein